MQYKWKSQFTTNWPMWSAALNPKTSSLQVFGSDTPLKWVQKRSIWCPYWCVMLLPRPWFAYHIPLQPAATPPTLRATTETHTSHHAYSPGAPSQTSVTPLWPPVNMCITFLCPIHHSIQLDTCPSDASPTLCHSTKTQPPQTSNFPPLQHRYTIPTKHIPPMMVSNRELQTIGSLHFTLTISTGYVLGSPDPPSGDIAGKLTDGYVI